MSAASADARAAIWGLIDRAMLNAAARQLGDPQAVVAVDMHLQFMKPCSDTLQASAQVTGGGRSTCFCEARVTDPSGGLVAQAMGTYRRSVVDVRPQADLYPED